MRIRLLTMGSRGDVQPVVALATGLARAGHDVRVVSHASFEGLVRSQGLDFAPAEGNPRALIEGPEGRAVLGRGGLQALRWLGDRLVPLADAYARDCLAACADADIVGTSLVNLLIGQSVAERLGIPWFAAYPVPMAETRVFPSPGLPPTLHPLPGWNRLSHRLVERVLWRLTRDVFQHVRTHALGLPPYPRGGPFPAIRASRPPLVVGVSPNVLPPPPDWPEAWQMTGYWFLPEPEGWVPPPDLAAFLADGPPPVYVGFGSMTGPDPSRDTAIVLAAADLAGARVVISRGWAGLHAEDLPRTAHLVGEVPHGWLFPRLAAIVHHAGAGTAGAAVRAGVPSVSVPFFADQPFWAWRLRALGVSPPPLPYRRLSVPRLATALCQVLGDAPMRDRARDLGLRVRTEDGTSNAVKALHREFAARGWG